MKNIECWRKYKDVRAKNACAEQGGNFFLSHYFGRLTLKTKCYFVVIIVTIHIRYTLHIQQSVLHQRIVWAEHYCKKQYLFALGTRWFTGTNRYYTFFSSSIFSDDDIWRNRFSTEKMRLFIVSFNKKKTRVQFEHIFFWHVKRKLSDLNDIVRMTSHNWALTACWWENIICNYMLTIVWNRLQLNTFWKSNLNSIPLHQDALQRVKEMEKIKRVSKGSFVLHCSDLRKILREMTLRK